MTTLSAALNYALSGLSVSSAQSALLSRNVSFAGSENYTRKSADIISLAGGGAALSAIKRSTDRILLEKLLDSNSGAVGSEVLFDAAARISAAVGDPAGEGSLAATLGKLQKSLSAYEANPASVTLASSAVEASRNMVEKLNFAATEVRDVMTKAEAGLQETVERVNSLLAQFKVVNDAIVRGQGSSSDLTEVLDQRDGILKLLSQEIGIRTVTRPNNDLLIYADGGAVLFEGSPRAVRYTPAMGADGGIVDIDGVAVIGRNATMPIRSGRLLAFATVRDNLASTAQRQIDFIASSLVRQFAESDQSTNPSLPDVPGLFIDSTTGILPGEGETVTGLAGRIRLNPLADPGAGGDPFLIRDGGFGGGSYIYNKNGYPSFQDRVSALVDSIEATIVVDVGTGLGSTGSLKSAAVDNAAWIENQRQFAQASADSTRAARSRASDSLLRVTGVNIDDEMAALLDLEKAYQASSKIITVVDSMLASLLEAVR